MFKIHVEREIAVMHQLKNHKGKCKQPHGHNLFIEVDVESTVIKESEGLSNDGMLADFGDIKHLIDEFDHTDLNESLGRYVDVCKTQPTAERLARFLACSLSNSIIVPCSVSVRVHETKGQWAQYTTKE